MLGAKGLLGRLPRGAVGGGTVTFRGDRWGELAVEVRLDTTDPAAPFMELTHETRDEPTQRIDYRVRLTTTRPRYGGERWWFVCPSSGRRVFKLYLPNGGRWFLCRAAYGLAYQVTREDALSRHLRRAGGILAKLGRPEAEWWGWAPKPKWMRHRTYERLRGEASDRRLGRTPPSALLKKGARAGRGPRPDRPDAMKGPPPWARQPAPEPETTPDGRVIVRKNGHVYVIEDGVVYVYLSPEEESARIERFLNKPAHRPAPRWDVWRS